MCMRQKQNHLRGFGFTDSSRAMLVNSSLVRQLEVFSFQAQEAGLYFYQQSLSSFSFWKALRKWRELGGSIQKWQFPENTVFCTPEFEFFYWSFLLSLIHLHSAGWQCWLYLSSSVPDPVWEHLKFKTLNPDNGSSQCSNNYTLHMLSWNQQHSGKRFQHSGILLVEATHYLHSCLFEWGFSLS